MATPNVIASTPIRTVLTTIATWLTGLAFALPLLWMLGSSLRSTDEIFGSLSQVSWRMLIPERVIVDNYAALFEGQFALAVFNSVFVTAVTVVVGLIISALAAFALSIMRFRGAKAVFSIVVLSFLIPFDAIAIPLATLFRDWGLANTYSGLILPGLANGFAIFLLRQFFLDIPTELSEAARVDGLGWWGILWKIYVPLSRPALIGAGFTLFLFQWGAYLWPLLAGTSPDKVLGPIALANLSGQFEVDFGAIFAGSVLLTLVPMVLLLFFQKHFTQSLTATGSKN